MGSDGNSRRIVKVVQLCSSARIAGAPEILSLPDGPPKKSICNPASTTYCFAPRIRLFCRGYYLEVEACEFLRTVIPAAFPVFEGFEKLAVDIINFALLLHSFATSKHVINPASLIVTVCREFRSIFNLAYLGQWYSAQAPMTLPSIGKHVTLKMIIL